MITLYLIIATIIGAMVRASLKTWVDSENNNRGKGCSRKNKHGYIFFRLKKKEYYNRLLAYMCYVLGILNYREKIHSKKSLYYVSYRKYSSMSTQDDS